MLDSRTRGLGVKGQWLLFRVFAVKSTGIGRCWSTIARRDRESRGDMKTRQSFYWVRSQSVNEMLMIQPSTAIGYNSDADRGTRTAWNS